MLIKMTKKNEIYKCNVCGNVVEVLTEGKGELVCCGKPMELMKEKTEEEGNEKHKPVIEKDGDKITVKVGSVPHPMEEDHYIQQIEALVDGKVVVTKKLFPGDLPEMELLPKYNDKNISARTYCNLHGLWKSD